MKDVLVYGLTAERYEGVLGDYIEFDEWPNRDNNLLSMNGTNELAII
jgi:hypothetical protein